MSDPTAFPAGERLGFADLLDRLWAEAPRRDAERILFGDLGPELRERKIGAIRLPGPDGSRLPLTEFFQFILELAAADSNLAHSLRNHYAWAENAVLDPAPDSARLLALAADKEHPRYPFTFQQVYLTTVVAGIANRALRDAADLVRARTRNYYHGTSGRVPDEPVIRAAIGVASAKAFAATATIGAAPALLGRSYAAPRDFGLSLEATLAATRAKITVESLALGVIDALTQVASGSTLSTERALDRHWRNVKVLASHNPTIYKQQILGAYELHGTQPPLDIYF